MNRSTPATAMGKTVAGIEIQLRTDINLGHKSFSKVVRGCPKLGREGEVGWKKEGNDYLQDGRKSVGARVLPQQVATDE